MKTFTSILLRKIEHVRSMYPIESNDFTEHLELDNRLTNLYERMQRWHVNAHMLDHDWLLLFDRIKVKLPSESKYDDAIMSTVMHKYLEKKFKKTNLKEMLAVCQIFSTKFEEAVLEQFRCITNQDKDDEFDTEFVFSEYNVSFYQRVFLPLAVYLTYKEKHPDAEESELLQDCFDIGAGSKRYDLCPEVNAYCNDCSDIDSQGFSWEQKNFRIFKMQVDNKFQMPLDIYTDSEDSASLIGDDPHDASYQKIFNPFIESSDTDCDSEGEESPIDIFGYECWKCNKKFSEEVFLQYHMDFMHGDYNWLTKQPSNGPRERIGLKAVEAVFVPDPQDLMTTLKHASPKKVKAKFVSEPEDLITSFKENQQELVSKVSRIITRRSKKNILEEGKLAGNEKIKKNLFSD